MELHKDIHPPKWAARFLNWYCKKEIVEDLEGDLNEYFERNVKSKGVRKAKLIYLIDVLKFLRPYTIRKPKFVNLLIQWVMIGSYIKTSGRTLVRNSLFSSINIVGLAISMSVGLMMISMLSDLFSYDKFHVNRERIYRVVSQYQYLDRADDSRYASTSLRAANAIKESFTGVEKVVILRNAFDGDVKFSEKVVSLSGKWANENFFSVFTFPMIDGDPLKALKDPYSVVLTETASKKLFGDAEAIGKAITIPEQEHEFIVTGVMKDVPLFSHMRFDLLASFSTREIVSKNPEKELSWDNMWNHYAYLLLPENADLVALQKNLNALCAKENATVKNTTIRLALQPMNEIALGEEMNNSIGPVMAKSNVWMIGVLSFIVILSACFNYTNLSIARSLRRSREVGIRKVVGALKSHVLVQFVIEAVMIALIALAFSFLMFMLLRPYFLSLDYTYNEMLALDLFYFTGDRSGNNGRILSRAFLFPDQCHKSSEEYFFVNV
jgi:putative ABC transport system permease protein